MSCLVENSDSDNSLLFCGSCKKKKTTAEFSRAQVKRIRKRGKAGSCKSCQCSNGENNSSSTDNTDANIFLAPKTGGGVVLTMWQPWASLVVHGLKRAEGRPWLTDYRGELWIHAGGKPVNQEEIKEIESFYKNVVYKDMDPVFPSTYPTSVIVGCIYVRDCLTKVQFKNRYQFSNPRMFAESSSESVFVCDQAQRLIVPFGPMKGNGMLWTVSKKERDAMKQGLVPTGRYVTEGIPLPSPFLSTRDRENDFDNDENLKRALALSMVEQ